MQKTSSIITTLVHRCLTLVSRQRWAFYFDRGKLQDRQTETSKLLEPAIVTFCCVEFLVSGILNYARSLLDSLFTASVRFSHCGLVKWPLQVGKVDIYGGAALLFIFIESNTQYIL
jgi:hypothetical protein